MNMGFDDGVTSGMVYGGVMVALLVVLGVFAWLVLSRLTQSETARMHRKHGYRMMRRGNPVGVMMFGKDGYRVVYDASWLRKTGRSVTEAGWTLPVLEPQTLIGMLVALIKRTRAQQGLSHRR